MNRSRFFIIILIYLIIGVIGFNYLIIQQEDILRRYFIIEPRERAKEMSASLALSMRKYFTIENASADIEKVKKNMERYGSTSLYELLFIFEDKDGSLKQMSKTGLATVDNKALDYKWVYPVTVDSGKVDGYLVVMIKEAGEAELKEGLKKYVTISYSLRFLFILLLLALSTIVLYHIYSAKMKLARELAEIKASNDGMTGLHTHEHFMKALEIEVGKFKIYNMPVALFMLDIDHFKEFNDRFGHQAGDAVLKEVSAIIKMNARATDILARYGGEEFAVLIPYVQKTDEIKDPKERLKVFVDEVKNMAERIRESVKEKKVKFLSSTVHVTISIGVAYYFKRFGGATSEFLLRKADTALYKAKRLGRDRVSIDYESSNADIKDLPKEHS